MTCGLTDCPIPRTNLSHNDTHTTNLEAKEEETVEKHRHHLHNVEHVTSLAQAERKVMRGV